MALSYPTIQKKKTYVAPSNGSTTLNGMSQNQNPYEYNPGGNSDQSGGVAPANSINGMAQQQNSALNSLPENLAQSYQNTLNSMMNGSAYSAYKTSAFQGMNKSAQQLRANAQQANVGRAGQGTALANKNATEASIAQMAGDTALNATMGEQEMKERGLTAANTLATMNEITLQNAANQKLAYDTAYGYVDPLTGQRVRGSNELAGTQTDIQQQQANTTRDLGYAQITSNEKISQNQLNESARQYNITNDTDKQQFAATMKLNYDQLSETQKQFLMNFGLDEAKFNQAKTEFTQNVALEEKKLASNEKIATAQLGLGYAQLKQAADQFGISTAEAAKQYTEKLKFDYASLSQNDKQFLQTLQVDQAKFEESKRQFDLNYSLEDKLRTKDLALKEQEIANNYSTATSRLDFDKQVQAENLTEAEKTRIWQAIQNEKSLQNAKDVQQMIVNQDQWKQNKVDELTRAGWTVEDARASADRQQQLTIATMQNNLTKEVEAGRITQAQAELAQQATQFKSQQEWNTWAENNNIAEADKNRAWTTSERIGAEAATAQLATVQGQLQKELAAGTWIDQKTGQKVTSTEAQRLIEQTREFNSQEDYNKWAVEKGISQENAKMAWETNERIENNIHQLNMQTLQNKFTEKGWGTEIITSILQNQQMDPKMAQAYLQDMAEAAGITHTVLDDKGNAVEVPGFENFSQKAYDNNSSLNTNLSKGVIPAKGVSATEISNMTSGWDTYVENYPNMFVNNSNSLENFETVKWQSGAGKTNKWALSSEAKTWVNENTGKLTQGSNGKVYKVVGFVEAQGTNSTGYVSLVDVSTGKSVKYSGGGGGSAKYKYVE